MTVHLQNILSLCICVGKKVLLGALIKPGGAARQNEFCASPDLSSSGALAALPSHNRDHGLKREVVYTPKVRKTNYMNKLLSLDFFRNQREMFSLIKTVIKYLISAPLNNFSHHYSVECSVHHLQMYTPCRCLCNQLTIEIKLSTAEVCQSLNTLQKYAVLLGTARSKAHISPDQRDKVVLICCHLPR